MHQIVSSLRRMLGQETAKFPIDWSRAFFGDLSLSGAILTDDCLLTSSEQET